jgi:hypothetical protein
MTKYQELGEKLGPLLEESDTKIPVIAEISDFMIEKGSPFRLMTHSVKMPEPSKLTPWLWALAAGMSAFALVRMSRRRSA